MRDCGDLRDLGLGDFPHGSQLLIRLPRLHLLVVGVGHAWVLLGDVASQVDRTTEPHATVFAFEACLTFVAAAVCLIVKGLGWAAHDWNDGSNGWLVLDFHVIVFLLGGAYLINAVDVLGRIFNLQQVQCEWLAVLFDLFALGLTEAAGVGLSSLLIILLSSLVSGQQMRMLSDSVRGSGWLAGWTLVGVVLLLLCLYLEICLEIFHEVVFCDCEVEEGFL